MTQQPQAKYRHDYRAPDYLISDIDLTFDTDAAKTVVTAESKVSRHAAASDVPLRLDGEDLTLISLQVNGQPWSDYKEENNQLVIGGLPDSFTLTIVNEISPAANTALEGLYQSGEALCTQCEAEGFRHITRYLDRPDVLARFTTKIIADKAKYPYLLSNGNRVAQGELDNGRHWISGRIRSQNPVTCSRWWPAISMCCVTPSPPVPGVKSRLSCTLTAATSTARRGR